MWLFLAIEQLPLAAEESIDPKRDMPKGIILGMLTLIVSAGMIVWLNPSVIGVGSFALGKSGEPLLDGFRAIYGGSAAKILAFIAVIGLIASFHTIIYAKGRQIYSLSRAGYFPTALSVTHGGYKTPHVAMIVGALVGFGRDVRRLVRRGFGEGGRHHRRHAAEHGRVRRHVLLHPPGDLVHHASPQPAEYRAALSQPARHSRRAS